MTLADHWSPSRRSFSTCGAFQFLTCRGNTAEWFRNAPPGLRAFRLQSRSIHQRSATLLLNRAINLPNPQLNAGLIWSYKVGTSSDRAVTVLSGHAISVRSPAVSSLEHQRERAESAPDEPAGISTEAHRSFHPRLFKHNGCSFEVDSGFLPAQRTGAQLARSFQRVNKELAVLSSREEYNRLSRGT